MICIEEKVCIEEKAVANYLCSHESVILVITSRTNKQQGKSEGFESCDWPIVRKRPLLGQNR